MKKIGVLFLFIFSGAAIASSIELNSAPAAYFDKTDAEIEIAKKLLYPNISDPDSLPAMTFTNLGSGDIYYGLYSDMHIRAFNLTSKQLLGDWKLGNNNQNFCPDSADSCENQWHAGRWTEDEFLEEQIIDDYNVEGGDLAFPQIWNEFKDGGCLIDHPLRYGDISQSASQDLVVLMPEYRSIDLAIFSLPTKKVIFASKLYFNDVATAAEVLPERIPDTQKAQFWSKSGAEGASSASMSPALKSFAKLYAGDFDNDGKRDLIVWRKLYQSRLQGDAINGYEKKSDQLVHYAFINGSFKKQATESADVKAWLTSKNLTWSKGYPNKSECAGQTNQLIPEMHDPLLNDPDVLQ